MNRAIIGGCLKMLGRMQLTEEARATRHYASPPPGEPGFRDLPLSARLAPPPEYRAPSPEPAPADACREARANADSEAWEGLGPGRPLAFSRLGLGWGLTPLAGASPGGILVGGPREATGAPTVCAPAPLAAAAWASAAVAGGRNPNPRTAAASSGPGPAGDTPRCLGAGAGRVAPPGEPAMRKEAASTEALGDMGRHAAAPQQGRSLGGVQYAAPRQLGPSASPVKNVDPAARNPVKGLGAKVACWRAEPCFQVAARCGGGHVAADPGTNHTIGHGALPAGGAPSAPAQAWRAGAAPSELAGANKRMERRPAPLAMDCVGSPALLCLERLSPSSAEEEGAAPCPDPNPVSGGGARAGDALLSMERPRAPGACASPPAILLPGSPERQRCISITRGPAAQAVPAPAGSPSAQDSLPLRASAQPLLSPASGAAAATLHAVRIRSTLQCASRIRLSKTLCFTLTLELVDRACSADSTHAVVLHCPPGAIGRRHCSCILCSGRS